MLEDRPYLKEIEVDASSITKAQQYPFNLPALQDFGRLKFHKDVTFFVGENGSGKSTLLESIALAMGINPEGGNKNTTFATKNTHSHLGQHINTIKSYFKPSDYYFLRAESFYNVASYIDSIYPPPLQGYGGTSLHEQSHGESFMATLEHKLNGNGLYLMDEPEAALSPSRQLRALHLIHQLVKKHSQFIIATHSPILLSYPNAIVYQVSEHGIQQVKYEQTEHYEITLNFLSKYKKLLYTTLSN